MLIFRILKYVATGAFLWFVASFFSGNTASFVERSDPAMLMVVSVQKDRDHRHFDRYRPVFALEADTSPRREFAGNSWSMIKYHQAGDSVPGRHDAQSGEMRSDRMIDWVLWSGFIGRLLGLVIGAQAIALLLGIPEERLPLPVRIGRRRNRGMNVLRRHF